MPALGDPEAHPVGSSTFFSTWGRNDRRPCKESQQEHPQFPPTVACVLTSCRGLGGGPQKMCPSPNHPLERQVEGSAAGPHLDFASRTSGLQNRERINFCCSKPLILWQFVPAASGNELTSLGASRACGKMSPTCALVHSQVCLVAVGMEEGYAGSGFGFYSWLCISVVAHFWGAVETPTNVLEAALGHALA